MPTIDENGSAVINAVKMTERASAPETPASGGFLVYVKTDGKLYTKNDAGIELCISDMVGGYIQGARVYKAADSTIPSNSETYLTFDSETYDTDTCHSTSSNTGRLTATTAGKYIIGCHLVFSADGDGYRRAVFVVDRTTQIAEEIKQPGGNNQVRLNLVTVYDLTEGQYVEVLVYHNAGNDLTIYGNNTVPQYSMQFWMQRIG